MLRLTLFLLVALAPVPTLAQPQAAGTVINIVGTTTVARATSPQPIGLSLKDAIFLNDRIVTGDGSSVKLLFGDKVVVTMRERSALTLSEVHGLATINLVAGKMALALSKDRMRPDESLEVRTPNAIARVRSTIVAVEVAERPAVETTITVLRGVVFAGSISSLSRASLGPNQSVTITGNVLGPVRMLERPAAWWMNEG